MFYYCEDRISLLRDFLLKKICDKIISITMIRPHGQWLAARGNRKSRTSFPMTPAMCFNAHRRITYGQLTLPGPMSAFSNVTSYYGDDWLINSGVLCDEIFFFFRTNMTTWGLHTWLESKYLKRTNWQAFVSAGQIKLVNNNFSKYMRCA